MLIVAAVIVGVYFLARAGSDTALQFDLAFFAACGALAAGVAALVTRVVARGQQAITIGISISYLLLIVATLLLVGGSPLTSPHIALWIILALVSALVGIRLSIGMLVAVTGGVAWLAVSGNLASTDIVPLLLVGQLPLIVSALVLYPLPRLGNNTQTAPKTIKNTAVHGSGNTDTIIMAMSEGVITLDDEGIITLINPAAQTISGWSEQDALKLNYKSILKLTDDTLREIPDAENPIAKAMQASVQVETKDLTLTTKSDKRIKVSLVVTPVTKENGGAIVVFRNITKEKAEEGAQAEFISTASHEMRTPVASIEGYLGLALNPNTATIDEKAREFITKAHESAQHLGRLFQDLLDVSKADDGRMANKPQPIDVVAFLKDITFGLKPKADEKGLELVFAPEAITDSVVSVKRINPTFYVNVDRDHLREVVSNLVENAVKYTPKGTVKVDVTGDDQAVIITVADTGLGIPKEDVGHLFQKFYRVDNSDTREIGGTGLGLYLCRRLVEAMGGRIWVESEFKTGSTFFVQLTRMSSSEAEMQLKNLADAQARQAATEATQAPTPTAPPQPVTSQPTGPVVMPVTPSPPQSAPVAAPVTATLQQPPTHPKLNVPLSQIEHNPGLFTQHQRSQNISVPPREQQ